MAKARGSGILLHITSLPSPFGIGDMGPSAYRFVDLLAQTKQKYWQVLPLNPTNPACGYSPYSSTSAFAGNTALISPELLKDDGFLSQDDVQGQSFDPHKCEYDRACALKEGLFQKAYKKFKSLKEPREDYKEFCAANKDWLDDFVLFDTIRGVTKGQVWNTWKNGLKNREKKALQEIKKANKDEIEKKKFLQFLFFKQWKALRAYCNQKGIKIIGDIPIYVNFDSADVWTNPSIFKLNENKEPVFVSGVPPDYFSKTGQLWGNPVYNWEALKATGFDWWKRRMGLNLGLFDIIRVDHFRGLVSYWEVPAGEETAVNGKWADVPAIEFFDELKKSVPHLDLIAEDLGSITPEVKKILTHYKFPGMKVLLFAFNENNPFHPYLPHTFQRNWVVYTGTHDNNTVRGWFENEASHDDKNRLNKYLGHEVHAHTVNWELIRLAMMSVADIALFPLQDILGLGQDARMNVPSTPSGNWVWRFTPEQVSDEAKWRLAELTDTYGRG